MRAVRFGTLLSLGLLVSATAGACGDTAAPAADAAVDGPSLETDSSTDSSADAARDAATDSPLPVDATGDRAETGPIRAPFGLDSRPPNPTCRLRNRPAPTRRGLRFTRVFANAGLDQPMALAQIPGDTSGRFFFIERLGRLVSVAGPNATSKTVLAVLPGTDADGEGGLLGFAFHPRFALNGFVYFSYTRTLADGLESVVVRLKSRDNGATFGELTTIIEPFLQAASNHKGGDLHFGPDGFLYASFGDGGGQGDTFGNGQRRDTFFSKIVRIDVDNPIAPRNYGIPDGNPFKAGGGEPATFAYGFRNPYRFSIDSVTGDVWAGDVGESSWEEIDKVVAGGNYGWSTREGPECFPIGTTCSSAGFVEPVVAHSHDEAMFAIVGGPVYRGSKMPARVGQLFYADAVAERVLTLTTDPATGAAVSTVESDGGDGGLAVGWINFGEDNAKEIYGIGFANEVYAIDEGLAPPPPPPVAFPEKLSDTGCFEKSDPRRPVAALIPYVPNSPFWSDGAEKERYFAIPDGTTIGVDASGDFDFPVGSVLAKTFRLGGRLVETRLFAKHDDGNWGGYSYEWNDAQSEATLLPAGKVKDVAGTAWTYPSRGDCFLCHTTAAGRSLGLEVGQLNGDLHYTSTNRLSNQLRTLDNLRFFTTRLADPATLPAFPSPFVAASPPTQADLEARARSYLHSNCSNCHRAGGPGRGNFDLRYGSSLAGSRMCGASPVAGDLGVAGAKVLVPASPATSLVSLRLRATGASRMPPVATKKLDTQGAQLIDEWVRSVTSCPP